MFYAIKIYMGVIFKIKIISKYLNRYYIFFIEICFYSVYLNKERRPLGLLVHVIIRVFSVLIYFKIIY